MKLVLQIALGVFFGTLASQITFDVWRNHKESIAKETAEKLRVEQDKVRKEQGERIRNLILQNRIGNTPSSIKTPSGFIPEDGQVR